MIETRINEIMLQMQSAAARARGAGMLEGDQVMNAAASTDFGAMLKSSIDAVNGLQQASGDLQQRFELGDEQVELGAVMVASEKAGLAFRAMTEVRNRLVDAYQEIMNMPV